MISDAVIGTETEALTNPVSATLSTGNPLDTWVTLVQEHTVVGFRQGVNLWVIHPSAKKSLHWQATHYDISRNSMMGDRLHTDIKGVLLKSTLDVNEPTCLMATNEIEDFILNSNARLYRASSLD